jgi:DNA repair protein RadC
MSIRDWPEGERPREKLLEMGPNALTEAELLAILLRSGVKGQSALDVARRMLVEFGSLRGLLSAERERLCRTHGLGPTRYAILQASLELARRHYQELMRSGSALANPRATREFLRVRLRDLPHEVFCCVFLDNRHRVIAFEELFRGTIDGASVHPREVVKQALARNAAAVILAHNHP